MANVNSLCRIGTLCRSQMSENVYMSCLVKSVKVFYPRPLVIPIFKNLFNWSNTRTMESF